jgi:hypothetical protein
MRSTRTRPSTQVHKTLASLPLVAVLLATGLNASGEDCRLEYARDLLQSANLPAPVDLKVDQSLGQEEAFAITVGTGGGVLVAGGGSAGVLYGVQQTLTSRGAVRPRAEKPDFELRGTVLFWMKDSSYDFELTPEEFPWFYDRELLTRYLDYLFEGRFNAIFLWSGFVFPSLVELPEYPEARTLSSEELRRNQEQFRWFTQECAKRNISVLVHFYNIHLTKSLANARHIPLHYNRPDPFAAKFIHYTLLRFLTEFSSVGLYVCPGEALESQYQPEWIRDVILKAAEDSHRNPRVVVRDWSLPAVQFKETCHYGNLFTELKHNTEMVVSPVPDPRHALWVGGGHKHIVNVHELADVKPFRWGSPVFTHEMVREWKQAGLDGAEVYGRFSWRWPYALDKLASDQKPFWPLGPKLLTFERDDLWLAEMGRYLWKVEREPSAEMAYWADRLARRFGSAKAGALLRDWYITTGPILPGLQNLTSVMNMNWFPTAIGKEQDVDAILSARQSMESDRRDNEDIAKAAVAWTAHYPSRPVDSFFLERYDQDYRLHITNRMSMPVAEYAGKVARRQPVTNAMAPDKIVQLLAALAQESEGLARQAQAAATRARDEAERYVTDSQAISLISQYYRAKVLAALEKQIWRLTGDNAHREALLAHMGQSVVLYRQLVKLTGRTYLTATDMITTLSWDGGLKAAEDDLGLQTRFVRRQQETARPGYWIYADEMQGSWAKRRNYPGFLGEWFRSPEDRSQTQVGLGLELGLARAGKYSVWVHALIGGATPDRALVTGVNELTFPASHGEDGPAGGKFVWHKVGEANLPRGIARVFVKAQGRGFAGLDVVVLTQDPGWQPPESPSLAEPASRLGIDISKRR